jgi:hypothetical protein
MPDLPLYSSVRRRISATQVLVAVAFVLSATNAITVYSAPTRTVSVPSGVGFEGYLLNPTNGQPLDGQHDLTFRLYDVFSGGSPLAGWSTNVYNDVEVEEGFYSVLLTGLPVANFTGDRWLGVTVDGGTEITPRTRIASVPFALNAQSAASVPWAGITAVPLDIANGDQIGTGVGASGGAVGRIPAFDTTTTLSGYSGLTYANGTNTLATGNLQLSGAIQNSTSLGARVFHNAHQSITNDTLTALSFNSERWDTDAVHDNATNNSRLIAKTAGRYLIGGGVYFTADPDGYRQIVIRVTFAAGGTKTIATNNTNSLGGTIGSVLTIDTVFDLAVNDYVELLVRHNGGTGISVATDGSNAYTPEFYLVRLP